MQHEQSLADIFRDFMKFEAAEYGCNFHSFSLDGQDRDTGGDYFITDSKRLAIIEIKYEARNLAKEKFKVRRLKLCQKLLICEDMRMLHDGSHFICWAEKKSGIVKTNIYRNEICNQNVFGASCRILEKKPTIATRISAKEFAKSFFQSWGKYSLSPSKFDAYLNWVINETSESSKSLLELFAYDPTSADLALVRLNSIQEALVWVRNHISISTKISIK